MIAEHFWEVPDFWKMIAVLVGFAAMATLAICFGPTEAPYDEDPDETDTPTQTRNNQ